MDTRLTVSGFWNDGTRKISVKLAIIVFKQDETYIAYCPALDVTGYGVDEHEARESFKISLSEFFKYTVNKKTLISEMRNMGWKIKHNTPMHPPIFSSLLEKNRHFNDIFNTQNFKKIDEDVFIPVLM